MTCNRFPQTRQKKFVRRTTQSIPSYAAALSGGGINIATSAMCKSEPCPLNTQWIDHFIGRGHNAIVTDKGMFLAGDNKCLLQLFD